MKRVHNFSAGPSMLPESVLAKAAAEMLDWDGTGQSVMEMSHRSKAYESIIAGAERLVREVMNVPEDYHVLFLQGGASLMFHMIPLNFMTVNKKADFTLTGAWATKAIEEAAKLGKANTVGSSKDKKWRRGLLRPTRRKRRPLPPLPRSSPPPRRPRRGSPASMRPSQQREPLL